MPTLPDRVRATVSSAGGAVLAGATRLVSLRPAAKPLHPRGDVLTGRLVRTTAGSSRPLTGAAWLDEAGSDEVLVRLSKAVGLPTGLPDIHGLAVRVPDGHGGRGRHGDLLFASTGLGRVARFVLTVGRTPYSRPMTTLLPYRTPSGAVLLAAEASADGGYRLGWARPRGAWHDFGELTLSTDEAPDAMVSFDPVRNTLPGMENYDVVRRLREPSYETARGSRRGR